VSNNLGLSQVTAAQNNKEVTINDQAGELDAAITVAVDIAVDNTNAITLTTAQFTDNNMFHIVNDSPAPTAAITVTVPAVSRGVFAVINETSYEVTVQVSGQTETAPTVATGVTEAASLITCDGTDCRSAGGGAGGGGGSTDFNKTSATLATIAATATGSYDLTGYFNRGIIHTIKITENHADGATGTYDVRLYKKDTKVAADLMYSVDAIDPTANGRVYQDDVVVYYRDDDATDELHLQIDNNDATLNMSFTIEIDAEVFETGVGGGGGDVVGPGSAVDSHVAVFDSTTGKLIKTSGYHVTDLAGPKDPIINGSFQLWQRGTTHTSAANDVRTADRFAMNLVTAGAVDVTKLTLADAAIQTATGQRVPAGFRVTVATADVSIAVGDYMAVFMKILADEMIPFFHNEFTISFYVRSNLTGTYAFACSNSGADRNYLKTFTIDSANTWERKEITVPTQDATGTWNYTTGVGLACRWSLMSGTDFHGTDAIWQAGTKFTTASQVNWMATVSNTFDITGIQMDLGPKALPLRHVPFEEALRRCERYYQKSYNVATNPGASTVVGAPRVRASATTLDFPVVFRTKMRATPTGTLYSTTGASGNVRDLTGAADKTAAINSAGESGFVANATSVTDGNAHAWHWTADAEI
jgi:hypothetical protein